MTSVSKTSLKTCTTHGVVGDGGKFEEVVEWKTPWKGLLRCVKEGPREEQV